MIGLPGDIDRTDPVFSANLNSTYVTHQVIEGLMGIKPGTTGEVIPMLAKDFPTVSDDGLTYTFDLQEGVKFHDGTPFNAEAVKYNYDRWRDLPEGLQGLAFFASRVFGGFGDDSIVESVDVLGEHQVAIKLKEPRSNFLLTQGANPAFGISSPTALKAGKADNSVADIAQIPYAQGGDPAAVGTGPFKFESWTPGTEVVIVRNSDYWNPDNAAHLDKIIYRPIPDPTAMLNALQAGDIDFAQTVDPMSLGTISSDTSLAAIERGQSCNVGWLGLSHRFEPVNNPKVREAMAYALNRPSYVEAFHAGQANVADNWMPLDSKFAKPLGLPGYDPDKARQLLAESGVTDLSLDFWYPSAVSRPYMPDPKGLFEAISRDLEAVGFTINAHTAPWSPDYNDGVYAGDYELSLYGSNCAWAGIDSYIKLNMFGYVDGEPNPEFGYRNDGLNQLMNDALAEPDEAKAADMWSRAQDLVRLDVPTIPLVNGRPPGAAHAYVKGFIPSGNLNVETFNTVWLEE